MQIYNSRKDVPEKYKWDLTTFFKSQKEFDDSVKKIKTLAQELKKYKGCTKSSKLTKEFLDKEYETFSLWEDLYVYSYLVNDQELGNSTSITNKGTAEQLNALICNNTSFFEPELLKIDKESYEKLVNSEELKEYKNLLDRIYREKEHILTENEEIIISSLTNAMNHYEDMSSNLLNEQHNYGKVKLDDGTTMEIANNNIRKLLRNPNPKIRKKAYTLYNKKLDEYSSTNASLLNSYVSMNNELAKIRHYKNSWEEKLFDLNLNDKVFKSLVDTTYENLTPLHRYYGIKKKALGLDTLHTYDLQLNLNKVKQEISIEEAQNLVLKSLEPLGNEYQTKIKKVFDNRYIDYAQYKGKCSGGYSFATMTQDSRILMSYNYDLDSVSTIAHEGGHNVHHQFIKDNNKIIYREPSSIVCEVASLTNECLLSSYIANNGTKDEKIAGLNNIINVIVSNLYGAVREGKLEQDMYKEILKRRSITKEYLDKKSKSSLKKFYGKEVKTDKYIKNNWVTRSHYYMHFYLYSYAICISVASYVASKILSGDKNTLDNYIKFLKTGSDKWPSESFAILGINLEDKNVYEEAIKYFNSLLDKLEEVLGEE